MDFFKKYDPFSDPLSKNMHDSGKKISDKFFPEGFCHRKSNGISYDKKKERDKNVSLCGKNKELNDVLVY